MNNELPRLVILDLYRNAIDTVERMSRKHEDKKIHAWAMKTKKELGKMMLDMARDEMTDDIEDEEDKARKQDEDFYS